MSRDVTVFGFEVDIETVRYVAEELFGVSPSDVPTDEQIDDEGRDDEDRRDDVATSTDGSDALSRSEGHDEDGGSDSGGWTRRLLLAVGLIGTLGLVGLAVVWYLRRRGGDDEHSDAAETAVEEPDAEIASEEPADGSSTERPAGESESEEPPAPDFSPYIGMVFLAVSAAVVRWLRGESGADSETTDGAESARRADTQPPR
ncbi:MAG: hypothetical protein ABEH35_00455 [Haloarculaceae archaeon]